MTHTRTFVTLEVSRPAFDEIKERLANAGYSHAFREEDTIDMHGLALSPAATTEPTLEARKAAAFDWLTLTSDGEDFAGGDFGDKVYQPGVAVVEVVEAAMRLTAKPRTTELP